MAKRLTRLVVLAGVTLAAACASAPDPGFSEDAPNEIELVLVNDYRNTVSAYVQWIQGSPQPLAEVPSGESRYLRVPVRGSEVRVLFVPIGRSPGDPREPGYMLVGRGDGLEWRLRSDRTVFSQRLRE